MTEAIQKFTTFLEQEIENYDMQIKLVVTKQAEIIVDDKPISLLDLKNDKKNMEKTIAFFNLSKTQLLETNSVLLNYRYISSLLDISPLSIQEKKNVLLFLIDRNWYVLEKSKFDTTLVLDTNEFKKVYAPQMNAMKYQKYLESIDFTKILNSKNCDLNEEELKIRQKTVEVLLKKKEFNTKVMTCHRLIKKHYLDKIDSYNEKDIKFIKNALLGLSVDPKLVEPIVRILKKELQKRTLKNEKKVTPIKSDFNYKIISEEVENYIDINTMDPKRFLTKEEEIYVLTLLTRLKIPKEQRRNFLRKNEMLEGSRHPFVQYMDNYNRFKFYEDAVGIRDEVAFMEKCFEKSMLSRDADYIAERECLTITLKEIEQYIPKNFLYEETEANSRLLKK